MNNLLKTSLTYIDSGISVIPVKLTKQPILSSWKPYQKKIPSLNEITVWFSKPGPGTCVAMICGGVSGNLELLDFDAYGESYEQWCSLVKEEAPKLFEKLVVETSQNKGFHVVYRNKTQVHGNQKLAQKGVPVSGASEYEYKGKTYDSTLHNGKWYIIPTLIETRGEGGYFLCAPSQGYTLVQNNFLKIPTISIDDRNTLINAAKSLNEWIPEIFNKDREVEKQGGRPGDDFNDRGNVTEILGQHGWTKTGRNGNVQSNGVAEHYRRPGKARGQSASLIDKKIFYVFTSNGAPFDNDKAYSQFAVYTLLEHSGNYSEAAKALAEQGYGEQKALSSKEVPLWVQDALLGVKLGRRGATCTKLAGYYLRLFKGDKRQSKDILHSWNDRNEPPLDRSEVEKNVDSIGEKHKIIALSEVIGFEIFQIEIIRRDTHDLDYLFYLQAGVAKMCSKDVLSPSCFTRRIFELTKRPPILTTYTTKKKTEWLEIIGDALVEATEIQTSVDETSDEPVIDAINYFLSQPVDDVQLLDIRPVVVDGMILLKIKSIKNHLRGQGEKITAKEIGGILRGKLKFKNERVRIAGVQGRLWKKPLKEWTVI